MGRLQAGGLLQPFADPLVLALQPFLKLQQAVGERLGNMGEDLQLVGQPQGGVLGQGHNSSHDGTGMMAGWYRCGASPPGACLRTLTGRGHGPGATL